MPDRRRHRGPHPGDAERFVARHLPVLRQACSDLGWLAARGYSPQASLQLVGDRFRRDLASVHGTWRSVDETLPAARLLGERLHAAGVGTTVFWLDAPVGNSGRLAVLLRALAARHGWHWRVEVGPSPDRMLQQSAVPIATADSGILDGDVRWVNLARSVIDPLPDVWLVDLCEQG